MAQIDMTGAAPDRHPLVIFLIFLRLGLTSFGGPIAHLGYFRAEFVTRRRWLDENGHNVVLETLPLVAEGTCYSVEFADFLKKMVGHLPSDGPMRGAILPD